MGNFPRRKFWDFLRIIGSLSQARRRGMVVGLVKGFILVRLYITAFYAAGRKTLSKNSKGFR